MPEFSLDKYLESAVIASIDAGKEVMKIYNEDNYDQSLKEDLSPVTEADLIAHDIITTHLRDTRLPLLSEEGKNISYPERKEWDVYWLVDPLDGTREFIRRNGEFTINIALLKNRNPCAGVVYAPATRKLYFALKESGSFRMTGFDTKDLMEMSFEEIISLSIRLPRIRDHSAYTIVVSRSHRDEETEKYIRYLKKIHKRVNVASCGSALKFCLVAEGHADIYPRFGPTFEWDTAAGHAVAEMAGCKVIRQDTGKPLTYNKEDLVNPWFIVKRG